MSSRLLTDQPNDREQLLLRRARRCVRRGEDRRAMLALREACFHASDDARLWTLYAVQCWRAHRNDEALRAFRQALWLRERLHQPRRARVLSALIAQVESGAKGELRAA